ncbi:MAG: hypothetical protein ABJA94_07525 [Rhodoglobus sp.]
MTRTTINYDGQEYVVARSAEQVKGEIHDLLGKGEPGWLVVNRGRGELQKAELLIAPGIPVALVDTSDPAAPETVNP